MLSQLSIELDPAQKQAASRFRQLRLAAGAGDGTGMR